MTSPECGSGTKGWGRSMWLKSRRWKGISRTTSLGLPGVGKKTAIRLLTEYGSIEGIYEHIDEVSALKKLRGAKKIQQTLIDYEELARQCKMLTTIRRDAPVTLDLDAARFGGFARGDVLSMMRELEFFSMLNRIPSSGTEGADGGQLGMFDEAEAESRRPPSTSLWILRTGWTR